MAPYVTIIMQTYPMERWMHGLCVKDVGLYGVLHSKSPRLMLLSIHSTASQSYEAKPRRRDNLKRFQDLLNRIHWEQIFLERVIGIILVKTKDLGGRRDTCILLEKRSRYSK